MNEDLRIEINIEPKDDSKLGCINGILNLLNMTLHNQYKEQVRVLEYCLNRVKGDKNENIL